METRTSYGSARHLQRLAKPGLLSLSESMESGPCRGPGGERRRFARLIEAATQEISQRYPGYFRHFGVEVEPLGVMATRVRSSPALMRFSPGELETALVRGIQVLDDLGVRVNLCASECDAVSLMLLLSIFDAYASASGELRLSAPACTVAQASNGVPIDRCVIKQTSSGIRYAISMGKGRPLLIISTTGAPIRLWSPLFKDMEIRRPCLAVESRAGSLLEGGTPHRSSLRDDVANIREVLLAEEISGVDVVAWCNGARTALALAREDPRSVASLMLVSPTFHGAVEPESYPSPFEDQLVSAYGMVQEHPDAGATLIHNLKEPEIAAPAQLPQNRDRCADYILRLPPRTLTSDLLIPLSSLDYFKNYIGRVLEDEAYDIEGAIREIRCPVMLVTGTHDAAINTHAGRDVLSRYGHNVIHVSIFGAGHHIHLLQYGYFKHLLEHVAKRTVPVATARIDVQWLARAH